jgi:hypothetical protein
MDSSFDEGDFKKARGMLLSFSSILIALWFFGADLQSVSVFGTTVAFTKNTQHVWLAAMSLNAYFLLRFYQHSPYMPYTNNGIYNNTYRDFLILSMKRMKKASARADLHKHLSNQGAQIDPDLTSEIEQGKHTVVPNSSERRRLIQGVAHVVSFQVRGTYRDLESSEVKRSPHFSFSYPCPYWLVLMGITQAKIHTWVRTSHWTEYLMPYFWGGVAIAIAVSRWVTINITNLIIH